MKITPIIKYPDEFKGAKLTLSPTELLLVCKALKTCSEDPKTSTLDKDRAKGLYRRIKDALEKIEKGRWDDKRNNR